MLRKLLLFITLVFATYLNAQTYYWVGGSGYWNDVNHWSLISGGAPANSIPSSNSVVVFDNSSSTSSFTIHALQSVQFKSVVSVNTNFKIDVIGSPNVDLTIAGEVNLNEYFYFKLNGKISLNPQYAVKYQFSHNKFNNDIYLNAHSDIELGTLVTSKAVNISGNFKLKNSVILSKDINTPNAHIDLTNNILQASGTFNNTNSQFTNLTNSPSKIICKKNSLSPINLQLLNSVSNLNVAPISPQACAVPTPTVVFPTCQGVCDGIATFDLSGCSNPPYIIQWINPPCASTLPPAEGAYVGATYSVNTLCGCSSQYLVLFENALGEQTAVSVPIVDPPATILNFSSTQPSCNGLCDGQIRASVLTGAVPLSINWNPPNVIHANIFTKDTLKNACSGTYSVTATNANGCVNSFTTVLSQPQVLLANGSSSSVTCNAACNGSAAVAPTGGTIPYTYSWQSASSTPSAAITQTIGSLCPGVVTMTVTDSKTCTATFSATITQPPAITLTVTKTDLTCGNVCNGTASVTASGGIGPFTYSWFPSGGNAASASGLCAGDYTCTVTNNVDCIKTITVSVLSPPTLTTAPTQTDIACSGICIGAINLNTSGGTGAYTYSWSPNVSSTITATNLCAGAYNYTVSDVLGCKSISTVTITQPPATTLSIASTSITCNGACDGTATGNMGGGTGVYTYTWSPGNPAGQGTPIISNLCAGTYTLIVSDANNCSKTQTVVISEPIAIAVNISTTSPTCNGICNGSITSVPVGGTGPYTFTLQSSGVPMTSGPGANSSFTSLCAGSYTLLTEDTKGCVKTQTINLTQPNPITLALPFTPINCFNACNSTISTVVGGGTGPYSFTWSPSGSGNSQINQCAGVHSATVTDSKGCQASTTITITAQPDLTVSITPTNPNCNSQCTGIATTTISGGTPNYTINWNNGAIGNIVNNLCQGVYTATVTDFFGCVKIQTVAITPPPALTLTSTNGTVSCAGSCDGTVSVTASGGTAGYFYSWSPTAPVQTGSVAVGLCVGNYIASVSDANGCIASTVAAVAQPTVLTASIGNVQPSCNVCIGSATANGIGGTPPYTYAWAPGGQVGASPNNLCVGIQTLTVTDSKNCSTTQTVQISQTVITLITTNGSTLSCNGACNGIATANPAGGLAPYSYTWTPAPVAPTQTTQTASGLCFGTHTVLVSDANGCSSTNTVTFTSPPAITLTVNKTNVSCNGACNGVATANASGGTGAISYLWQPGGLTTASINGLCAGDYTVTATDINSCSQTQVVNIVETNSLTASFTFTNPSTCTSSDGSIGVVINGGTSPYTFTWTPGGSTIEPITNVGAGSYTLSITDAATCTQTISTTLSNPSGPTVTAVSNSIACFGSCTGSSTISIVGTGPFSVNGNPIAANTATLNGLCAGITTPIIMDGNSCVTNQTINISQPTQLIASGVVASAACNAVCSASVNLTPSGGTAPYSFIWSPAGLGEDPTNLCAGNYTVDVTDANNCVLTKTFVVAQPSALTLSFNKKDVLCNGQCTGGVRAIVGGGSSPYTYTWTPSLPFPGANIDTLVNLCSGIYTISATDVNGCVISGTVDIGQPTALTSTITSVNEKCGGQCNGSATINASGGVAPYSYNYNTTPITPTQTIGGLCIGTYTGSVSDANGCLSSNNFTITEPLPIVITTTISQPKCNAVCNGSVATTVTGGNPNYSYNWIPVGGPVPNPTGLCAGDYTLVVTDDSLCTGQALVSLIDPIILIANTSFTNPTCNAGCNGIVSANPIGGTAPFTFSWASPTVNSQTVSNLCAGDYTITLTDANGCQNIQSVTLTDPPAIILNPSIIPATCGLNNGSIDGIQTLNYNWLPPVAGAQSTNTMVTGLGAGVYTVIVTDASACSSTISIPLSNADGPSGATISFTNVTCNGQCNGAADVSNPIDGTAPYTLSWISPVSASSSISGLCAGTYTAEIKDANNCLYFQSVDIIEPQTIDDNEVITSAACLGNCNGVITLNPAGGNGGYSYEWSTTEITQTVSNLCPSVYTATITDVFGCTLVANYILPSLTAITSSTFATNNICFGNCDGSILATNVAGGLPPYTFSWSDPTGQSTATASNLCNGNYSVTIADANGCLAVLPSIVTSPSQITFTPTVTQPNCGLCDGSVVVNPIGGTAGYTFVWTNGQTISTASNLCAGVYGVQITDANACITNSNVVIDNSSTFTGETITQQDVSCGGICDGTVTVTAIGGAAPINYHWIHNGSSSQTLNGLCAGTYFCNMTDANGCTRTASVVINAVTNFTLTPQITQSSCSSNTGSISVNVVGGTGIYSYAWTPAAPNSPSVTGLAPGNYSLTVSDGNCSQTQVYSINSVNGPIVTSTQNDISCSGVCDGSISLVISGGTPTYTTSWSNGAVATSINGLCVGAYSYTVTDAAGCEAVQSFSLTETPPIVFSVPDIDNPLCNNNCNGVITSIPIGGTLPYTFSWAVSTSTTSVANALCSGNYSVTVSDANGCSSQETYTLTGPTSITVTAVLTNANCNGVANGAIDLTVSGGTPGAGYTYSWTPNNVSTEDLSSIPAGTYSVQITDANGCVVDTSFVITEPVSIDGQEIIASATCFGNCDGSITLNPIGGVGPYTYSWTPVAPNSATITNLCPGPQTATITDSQGCAFVAVYNIPSLTTITASTFVVNNLCFNDCNGVLTATNIAGGSAPYTINWNDPNFQTGNTATNLCTGSYSAIVTDANGCFSQIPADVSSSSQVTFTPVVTEPGCGLCDGLIVVNPSGGIPVYTYSWTNNQTGNTATNLCAGVYGVNITDGNGCVSSTNVIINSVSGFTGETIVTTDVTCGGNCDGTANVTAIGGTGAITYHWIHDNSTSQSVSNLCEGVTYFCNMTDANGCTRTASVVIGAATDFTITPQITPSSCSASTGSITVNVTGGTGAYIYTWLPAAPNSPSLTNLAPGNYTLTVSDGNCSQTQVYPINSVNGPNVTAAQNDISCPGVCDGSISLVISGGTPTYTTSWSNGAVATSINGLCVGAYSYTVTDAAGCETVQSFSLTETTPIVFSTPNVNSPLCNSDCNGVITSIPIGGTLPYNFNWAASTSTTSVANALCSGNYSVTVSDANGCSSQETYTLTGPTSITVTAVLTNVNCNGVANGAIDLTVSGGTPGTGYTYSWTPNNVSTEDLTNIPAGNYSVQITDANGCSIDTVFVITQPVAIDGQEVIVSATCFGNCDGSITLNPIGGVGPYTYSWTPVAPNSATITNLCPGPQTATITDSQGCAFATIYNIPSLTTITASTIVVNNLCFNDCNGVLTATNIAGGLAPYTINWNDPNFQTGNTAINLCTGSYSAIVTDANGCFSQIPADVSSSSQVTFTPVVTEPGCGLCDGSVVVNPVGGIAPYAYVWSVPSQTTNTLGNLCSGVYAVQITDGNNCVNTTSVVINSSSGITGETVIATDVTCGGNCDGTANVTAIGGTGVITYHWIHDNSALQTASNLCEGVTYLCNMTDENGCTRTASVVVGSVTSLTITPQIAPSSCSSSTGSITANVTGGTGAYNYIWLPAAPNSPSITNLAPGLYTLTVDDGNCSKTQVFSIMSFSAPVITAVKNDITCSTVCDGDISLTLSGGVPSYTTSWSNGATTTSISALCAGAYSVIVTDAAGCSAVQNFSLAITTPIVFSSPDIDNPLCNNDCNGVITSIPSGGTLPYTFSWAVSTSTNSFANSLCAGNYSVTVSDANGCSSQETYTLVNPSTISVTAVLTNATCNGAANGAIDLTVSGATPGAGYTYSWTPNNVSTEDLSNIPAGTYSVQIIDANGCSIDTVFVIAEPVTIVDNAVIISAACFGNCNGSITLNPAGGIGPYTYSWSPTAPNSATITSLCPGPQTGTITDSQGCTVVTTYNIPSLATITASTLAVNNICFNDCNGVLTATNIAGGVAPYTVHWNDPLGQIGNVASGLCTGNYTATIVGSDGCFNPIPANVSSTSQVTFTPNVTQPNCDACDGSAIVNPVGGTAPYSYLWSNNEIINTATNLCSGVYAVQITDGNGCVNTTNVVINSSSGITGETVVSTDVSCDASVCDGTANVSAIGGVAPITYHWIHDNSTSPIITGLCAGTYFCNMIDVNGCSRTASVVIGSVTTLTISSQIFQSSCSSPTGSITVGVSGGTGGPYTYSWLPAGSAPTISNLAPGAYTLTVSDGNCSITEIYVVQSINAPIITTTKNNITCSALCNGDISISITGGTPGYTTQWSTGAFTNSITGLCAGDYSVEVTDAAGCMAIQNISLSTVSPVEFSSPDLDSPKCHDACDGSLTAIPIGGTMPYTFTWTPININTATANGLCTGNYSIIVSDANGCIVGDNYSLINPPTLTLTATVTDASCSSALDGVITTTVVGGISPYTFNWTPGSASTPDLVNVLEGTYTLTLTDNFGCVIDSALTINSTLGVIAIAGNDTIFCQNGTLLLDGSNSSSTFGVNTYEWFVVPSASAFSNSVSTTVSPAVGTSTYVLVATNGVCIDSDTIVVNSNALPVVDAGPTVSIPLFSSAAIGGNPTCATGSSFSWSPIAGLDNPAGTNPVSGTTVTTIYTVTVIDVNGCSNSDTVTVYIYPEIVIPNGFSPNGDGKNDVWQIDFIDQFPDCEVEVYNRWGEQLFYSKGYGVPFNGQYKGKNLPVGTYYYVIKLNHPNFPTPYTSPLTIFR
jgi:gliding motility-associated-like protein